MAILQQLSESHRIEELVRKMVEEEGRSHGEISQILKRSLHVSRGLSTRAVRRYCANNNIHRTARLGERVLDVIMETCVAKVRTFPFQSPIFVLPASQCDIP